MAKTRVPIVQSPAIEKVPPVEEVPSDGVEDVMSIEDWCQSRRDISPELRGGFLANGKDYGWVYGTPSWWYAKYLSWANSKA